MLFTYMKTVWFWVKSYVDEMLEKHQVGIVGGIYDLATGKVKFLEDTFIS